MTGERADTVAHHCEEAVRCPRSGSRHGLGAHRIQQRVIQLTRHNDRDVAAALSRGGEGGGTVPLVLGGHHQNVVHLLRALAPETRRCCAGSFTADLHTLTRTGIRALSDPVIEQWVRGQEQEAVGEIFARAPVSLTSTGLPATVAGVNQGAVAHLLIAHEGLVPGFACGRCRTLSLDRATCPGCGATASPVPDMLEEMVQRVLDDKGKLTFMAACPFTAAARLRFPVA